MYVPKHFEPTQPADTLIEEVCFGTLVEYVDGALYAAHIPLHFDENRKWAYGHLAKANELAAKWVLGNSENDALFIIMVHRLISHRLGTRPRRCRLIIIRQFK